MHGNQLCQSTRFKTGRYQQGIRPCINFVGSCFIIHDVGTYTSFISIFIIPKWIFVFTIPGTKYYNLCMFIHDLRHDRINQIQSFLICQAGNQSDHKFVFILVQPQLFLQITFVFLFLIQYIGSIIVCIQSVICNWIPDVIVNTIYDTSQFTGMISQMGVQRFTIVFALDLPRIGIADRCDDIGVCQSPF